MKTGMKIVKLTAENFKKLKAIEIRPDGSTIMLTGKNGAGKSSVLDAIMSALCGKNYQPDKPIRTGQDHAEVVIETENYIVKRTFTESGGGTLTVTNSEGFKAASPQALLDKIVGEIAFDPMMFTAGTDLRSQREQHDTLMKLAGLDFSDIDAQIAEIKMERSTVKTQKEHFDHQAKLIEFTEGLPEEEVAMSELAKKLDAAWKHNAEQEKLHRNVLAKEEEIEGDAKIIIQQDELIKRLQEQLIEAKATRSTYLSNHKEAQVERGVLVEKEAEKIDTAPIKEEIASTEETNKKIRMNANRSELLLQANKQTAKFSDLGKQMKALEDSKATRLSEAKMPIEGLSVTDDGVVYEGIPLSQVNDAKKLEIGVAISMAMNPTLKVILVRNGSLLDSANKAFLSKLVDEKGYQVWMEVTDDSGKVGLVIEDGSIVANNSEPAKKKTAKPKRKAGEQLPLV